MKYNEKKADDWYELIGNIYKNEMTHIDKKRYFSLIIAGSVLLGAGIIVALIVGLAYSDLIAVIIIASVAALLGLILLIFGLVGPRNKGVNFNGKSAREIGISVFDDAFNQAEKYYVSAKPGEFTFDGSFTSTQKMVMINQHLLNVDENYTCADGFGLFTVTLDNGETCQITLDMTRQEEIIIAKYLISIIESKTKKSADN